VTNQEKILQKIRRMEEELVYATPKKAKKLTSEIVRLKGSVFD
jgi:hypothetical protein